MKYLLLIAVASVYTSVYTSVSFADYPTYQPLKRGIAYNGAIPSFMPSVTKARNGDILVQFNTTTDGWAGGKSYITRSSDEGETWSPPYVIAESTIPNTGLLTDIGLTTLSNGDVMFSFAVTQLNDGARGYPDPYHPGNKFVYPYVAISTDDGRTFGNWVRLPGMESGFGSPFGKPVEMSDGTLLLSMWSRYEWSHTQNLDSWGHSGFVVSHDHGRTWGDFTAIGPYGETSMMLLGNNTTFLSVGKRQGSPWVSRFSHSENGGNNWTEYDTSNFLGGKNASLHLSPNKFTMALLNFDNRGQGIFSFDDGVRWYSGFQIHPMLEDNLTRVGIYGYGVSAINLSDDRIMTVYYAQDPNKTGTGDSPWSNNQSYIGYTIVKERVSLGTPSYAALTDKPENVPSVTSRQEAVIAYPCPWKSSMHSGTPIKFKGASVGSTIRIFTIAAELVKSISVNDEVPTWDLTNGNGERVASGVYLYTVGGHTGKLAVIK